MIESVYVLMCKSCWLLHVVSTSEYMSLEYKSTRVPLNRPTVSDYFNITSECCCDPNYIETLGYNLVFILEIGEHLSNIVITMTKFMVVIV